jgi:hypothetical protein
MLFASLGVPVLCTYTSQSITDADLVANTVATCFSVSSTGMIWAAQALWLGSHLHSHTIIYRTTLWVRSTIGSAQMLDRVATVCYVIWLLLTDQDPGSRAPASCSLSLEKVFFIHHWLS